MADESRELTLYVQSKKAVTTFYRAPGPQSTEVAQQSSTISAGPSAASPGTSALGDPVYFLPDDQARCVAMSEDIAAKRGYRIKVVDVEKIGRIEQFITEHLRGVSTFPVLVGAAGHRLEGAPKFTEEELAAMMPTELKGVRAFSYLKVRGGDLDRIRNLLVGFEEVKELHFLTGDWDILVVLDFESGESNKRRVLDFVTDRIRTIPEILDTSTVVPEYTLTKFPLS